MPRVGSVCRSVAARRAGSADNHRLMTLRNSAIVGRSCARLTAVTRWATSSRHSRSIAGEERFPPAYACSVALGRLREGASPVADRPTRPENKCESVDGAPMAPDILVRGDSMTKTSNQRLGSVDLEPTGAELGTLLGRGRHGRGRRRVIMRFVVAGGVAAGVGLGVLGVAFANAPSAAAASAARTKTIRTAVAAGSAGATSKRELLQTLGILRTGPTAADRAVIACIKRSANKFGFFKCLRGVPEVIDIIEHPASVASGFLASLRHPILDVALIRILPLRRSGESVRFFPVSWQSARPSAPRTRGVVASLVVHGHEVTEVLPTSVRTLRAHGIPLLPGFLYSGRPKLKVHEGTIIVPDGVAKITVDEVSLGGGASVRENVTTAVHDNVATVELKMPSFKTGFGFGPGSALRMTWFDAHGNVIRHTTDALGSSGQVSPQ
jgi:hypothetical protein